MRARLTRGAARLVVLGLLAPLTAGALAMASPSPARAEEGIRADEYWLSKLGVTEAWKSTRGKGVTVAVIDSGVDGTHPDLKGRVVGGADFSGEGGKKGQKPVGSTPQHGTMVASLIAGTGAADDGDGMTGVAPEADLLSISVDFAKEDSDQQVADAITWAVDHGADVVNLSFVRQGTDWPRSWDDAFSHAEAKDVVLVAAAGNRGNGDVQVGAPATIPGVLAVGGVARDNQASVDASSQGITLGLMAPSEQLVGAVPGGGYVYWSGTSGAAPIVAGAAALVRAEHPELNAASVIQLLLSTASGDVADPPDPLYGYGIVDVERALEATPERVTENPLGSISEWVKVYRPASSPEASQIGDPIPIPSAASPTAFAGENSAWVAKTSLKAALPYAIWGGILLFVGLWVMLVARIVRARHAKE